jgi:hypothetical protein
MTIERRRSTKETGGYKVGYGRPPKHGQFKPGQSGHKPGRPKGVRNLESLVKATLKAPVTVTSHGKSRTVSTLEAMLLRLREKALSGDLRAVERWLQLAQIHSEDELAAAIGLSAEDTNVLRIYRQRVLSGAAADRDFGSGNEGSGPAPSFSTAIATASEPSPTRKELLVRYRPKSAGADGADHDK